MQNYMLMVLHSNYPAKLTADSVTITFTEPVNTNERTLSVLTHMHFIAISMEKSQERC